MPYEEALAERAIADQMPKGSDARLDHLDRAHDLFAQLGARFDLEKLAAR